MQLLQKLFVNACPLKLALKVSCGLVSAGISNAAIPVSSGIFLDLLPVPPFRVHCSFFKGYQTNLHMVFQKLNHHC